MLAHRLLGGGSSSLSVSCPSLGSALMAAAHARLWSSFRRRSESPLLAHQETKRQEKVSCLFGSSRPFPGLPPGQLWRTSPFRLCSRRQPQSSPCDLTRARASAPSPARPGRGADKPSGLVSAGRRRASVRESLRFALRTPVAALSSVAPKLPSLCHPQSLPTKGLLVCGNLSSFTAPSHWCRSHPYSLSLFFLFSFTLPRYVGSFLTFGRSEVFCQSSVGVLKASFHM